MSSHFLLFPFHKIYLNLSIFYDNNAIKLFYNAVINKISSDFNIPLKTDYNETNRYQRLQSTDLFHLIITLWLKKVTC